MRYNEEPTIHQVCVRILTNNEEITITRYTIGMLYTILDKIHYTTCPMLCPMLRSVFDENNKFVINFFSLKKLNLWIVHGWWSVIFVVNSFKPD